MDEARFQGLERLGLEAEALRLSWREILHQYVRGGCQPADHVEIGGIGEIENGARLAAMPDAAAVQHTQPRTGIGSFASGNVGSMVRQQLRRPCSLSPLRDRIIVVSGKSGSSR